MEIKSVGTYVKVNDVTKAVKDMFRYTVSGTADELAAYKASCGTGYREDEKTGKPFYFTQDFVGDTAELVIGTKSGRAYADTSELKKAASLARQFGGNLGDAIATEAARNLMGSIMGKKQTVAQAVAELVKEEAPAVLNEDLSKI